MQEESDTKILVINCGSSSLKYEVWQMPHRVSLGRGMVERIGELKGKISQKTPKDEYVHETQVPHHKAAMELVPGSAHGQGARRACTHGGHCGGRAQGGARG